MVIQSAMIAGPDLLETLLGCLACVFSLDNDLCNDEWSVFSNIDGRFAVIKGPAIIAHPDIKAHA